MVSLSCHPSIPCPPTNRVNFRHQILLSGTSAAPETLQSSKWWVYSPVIYFLPLQLFFSPDFARPARMPHLCVPFRDLFLRHHDFASCHTFQEPDIVLLRWPFAKRTDLNLESFPLQFQIQGNSLLISLFPSSKSDVGSPFDTS